MVLLAWKSDCLVLFGRVTLAAQVNRIRQFVGLPPPKCRLLLRAAALVAAVRTALWTLPFRWVRLVIGQRRAVLQELAVIRVKRVAWAVQAAARRTPGASCLTQAIAFQYLMAWAGHETEVHIGVAKDAVSRRTPGWSTAVVLGDDGELERDAPMLALYAEES